MNLSSTIVPKSNQLNSDDLISGPRTITISDVKAGDNEQPVAIHYDGDNGRPYKPCKSMRRVLVQLWGDDSANYIGRRLTLYRDPSIKFGADETGGIRISHASHIDGRKSMALTVTRGKRKPFVVEPLPEEKSDLPDAWNGWTNVERGEWMAQRGTARLKAWWTTLKPAERDTLQTALATWKATAAEADKQTATA